MDVLILAGGDVPDDLAPQTEDKQRALLRVGGTPMVFRVLDALRGVKEIERIAVVGADRVLELCGVLDSNLVIVKATDKMTQNFARGTQALRSSEEILVCTCDIPLVSSQTFKTFIQKSREKNLEIAYPIVTRAVCEQKFPDGKRTYARLGGTEVTGGNCVLLPTRIAPNVVQLLETAYNARKNPMALSKMLGANLVWKFVTKKLTIEDVEKQASRVLDCRVGAVAMDDATIAFDVDTRSHWQSAEKYLHHKKP